MNVQILKLTTVVLFFGSAGSRGGPVTMPIEKTLTNPQGKSIEGTIIGRFPGGIQFEKKSNKQVVSIQIDQLCAKDQEFVESLPIEEKKENPFQTKIIPRKYVFLALPFQKQEKGGICAAASALNVLQFIDPEFKLTQQEFFKLLNENNSGATTYQLALAIEGLGYELQIYGRQEWLAGTIKSILNQGEPCLLAKRGHMLTAIGYDEEKKAIIIWDQKMQKKSESPNLPDGAEYVPEKKAAQDCEQMIHVRKNKTPKIVNNYALATHTVCESAQFTNPNRTKEDNDKYFRRTAAIRFAAEIRKNHIVVVPSPDGAIFIDKEPNEKLEWEVGINGIEKKETINQKKLAEVIETNHGGFFVLKKS